MGLFDYSFYMYLARSLTGEKVREMTKKNPQISILLFSYWENEAGRVTNIWVEILFFPRFVSVFSVYNVGSILIGVVN